MVWLHEEPGYFSRVQLGSTGWNGPLARCFRRLAGNALTAQ